MSENGAQKKLDRRGFLKLAGLAGLAAQTGALVKAGIIEGEDHKTYTGWESFNPGSQFFNRTPFEFEGPAHLPVGEVSRPSLMTDYVFGRVATFEQAYQENPSWTLDDPLEELGIPPQLIEFYQEFPERLEWDYRTFSETIPQNREDREVFGNYYKLADAYSSGFGRVRPPRPADPPEVSDFEGLGEQTRFKSPELAAEFIKEVAHRYGATLVNITKLNPDFLYSDGWRGCPDDYDFTQKPDHWEYAIAIAVPMEWDVIFSSPQFSTSGDAYDRVSLAAHRLESCIKHLGYPARTHSPNVGYDLIIPPILVDAGMGEVARTGFCLTPELGLNARPAVITTNLPMQIDKPIHFGVAEFCNKCKLCAEGCPPGAISFADSPDGMVIRGYEHWFINNGACYNYWRETMGPMGCRLCVVTCPYSRKDNWIHSVAREIDARDPTGAVNSSLLWMQKNFFPAPDAIEYRRPPVGGEFASYRPEPQFMQAERYLDIPIVSPKKGD